MKTCPAQKVSFKAFTLVELLVVIGVVGCLACLVVPALARAKPKSVTAQCLSNKRQVQLGCAMYSSDFGNYLMPNAAAGQPSGWIPTSTENWTTAPANTNIAIAQSGLLAPYVANNVKLYSCPGDDIPSAIGFRIRSISMNGQVGGTLNFNTGYKTYQKISDMADPSRIWVFCDESMYSLNDGYLQSQLSAPGFPDCPAAYHDSGNCFTFVDGHAAFQKWVGPHNVGILSVPYSFGVVNNGTHVADSVTDPDWLWLRLHTAEPLPIAQQ